MKEFYWIYVCSLIYLLTGCIPSKKIQLKEWYSTHKILSFAGKELNNLPDSAFKFYAIEELYLGPADMTFYGLASLSGKKNYFKNLPAKICDFKHLKKLDLTFNNFNKIPDLSCLDSLMSLNLGYNENLKIVQNIKEILAIKNLKYLIVIGTYTTKEDIEKIKKQINVRVKIIYSKQDYIDYMLDISKTK